MRVKAKVKVKVKVGSGEEGTMEAIAAEDMAAWERGAARRIASR
jgi:hypothetical protein